MGRYAWILCAGLVAAANVGCAQVENTPAPPPDVVLGHAKLADIRLADAKCPDNTDFTAKIYILNSNYKPNPTNPGQYTPPFKPANVLEPFNSNKNATMTQDLNDAFNKAPNWFRAHLCSLSGIYISPAGCANFSTNNYQCQGMQGSIMKGAWGFRSFYNRGNPASPNYDLGNRYISVPARLWADRSGTATSHALAFNIFEDILLGELASWRDPIPGQTQGPHISLAATPNNSWITVLAAMAHEYGHVQWADTVLALDPNDPGHTGAGSNNYKFDQLTNCTLPSGASFDFYQYWDYRSSGNPNTNKLRPKGNWRSFHARDTADPNNEKAEHNRLPWISQFDDTNLTVDDKSDLFFLLYQFNQPWATYFGSLTPDEDFVRVQVQSSRICEYSADRSPGHDHIYRW